MTLSWWPCHKIVLVTFTFYIYILIDTLYASSAFPFRPPTTTTTTTPTMSPISFPSSATITSPSSLESTTSNLTSTSAAELDEPVIILNATDGEHVASFPTGRLLEVFDPYRRIETSIEIVFRWKYSVIYPLSDDTIIVGHYCPFVAPRVVDLIGNGKRHSTAGWTFIL